MAKKIKIGPLDNLDDVDEPIKEYYTPQADGKFIFTVAEYGFAQIKALKDENGARRISEKAAKDKLTETETLLAAWGENKPEEVLPKVERLAELEIASKGKVSEEKLVELAEARAKVLLVPVEKKLKEAETKLVESQSKITAYDQAEKRTKILAEVASIAGELGFDEKTFAKPSAALNLMALSMFKVDDTGAVVANEASGFTPGLAPKDALPDLLTAHPYLGKPSAGGGATGSSNGGAGGAPDVFKQNNNTVRMALQKSNPKEYERQWKQAQASGLKSEFAPYVPKA